MGSVDVLLDSMEMALLVKVCKREIYRERER